MSLQSYSRRAPNGIERVLPLFKIPPCTVELRMAKPANPHTGRF